LFYLLGHGIIAANEVQFLRLVRACAVLHGLRLSGHAAGILLLAQWLYFALGFFVGCVTIIGASWANTHVQTSDQSSPYADVYRDVLVTGL